MAIRDFLLSLAPGIKDERRRRFDEYIKENPETAGKTNADYNAALEEYISTGKFPTARPQEVRTNIGLAEDVPNPEGGVPISVLPTMEVSQQDIPIKRGRPYVEQTNEGSYRLNTDIPQGAQVLPARRSLFDTVLTPEQTKAIEAGDLDALAAAYPQGIPNKIVKMFMDRSKKTAYSPDQLAAIQSGDSAKLEASFPNGVPADALRMAMQGRKEARLSAEEDSEKLPAARVESITEGAAVSRMLPDIEETIIGNSDVFGPIGGRARAANPYDEKSRTIDAQMRASSQAFGRFMEGGVLRKEDEEKYRKMFPQLSDTPDIATNKLAIVRRILSQRYKDVVQSLKGSGYDVSGLIDIGETPTVPALANKKPSASSGAAPKQINSQAEYDALPSGAEYIDSEGNKARKR